MNTVTRMYTSHTQMIELWHGHPTLRNGRLEKPFGLFGSQVREGVHSARALAKQRHATRIAAERGNVVLDPDQRWKLRRKCSKWLFRMVGWSVSVKYKIILHEWSNSARIAPFRFTPFNSATRVQNWIWSAGFAQYS